MRATISFELELDKVESTMATLVSQEAGTLRVVTNILDNVGEGPLLPEVSEAIDLLQEVTNQLQQYQQMLAGFEKARFETMLPQPVQNGLPVNALADVRAATEKLSKFDTFLEKLNGEGDNDTASEEG